MAHSLLEVSRAEVAETVLQDHQDDPYFDDVSSLVKIRSLFRALDFAPSSEGSSMCEDEQRPRDHHDVAGPSHPRIGAHLST